MTLKVTLLVGHSVSYADVLFITKPSHVLSVCRYTRALSLDVRFLNKEYIY